ncbi:HupE/UreJ family protein [Intrasporangium mesophilum]
MSNAWSPPAALGSRIAHHAAHRTDRRRPVCRVVAVLIAAAAALLLTPGASSAHGFTSTAYADLSSPSAGQVRASLELEYDLLVVSAADAGRDDPLFRAGTAAFDDGDAAEQAAALQEHKASVLAYVSKGFRVSTSAGECTASMPDPVTMTQRDGVPYARLVLAYRCDPSAVAHDVTSTLFPDAEGYVRDTKTIVTYGLDLRSGSAALDTQQRTFTTSQSVPERFWEFFRLGAEHLLGGLDHILFLVALIAGSRSLREIVFAATTFTVAHSVTFILAALGVVHVPAAVVEPVIALSIAVVAAVPLWRMMRPRAGGRDLEQVRLGRLGLDRVGVTRLAIVFCFGLVHGLGFASALGIEQAWSWTLLWSLLVFNVGIEAVQVGIILAVFPALAFLRHRAPVLGLRATGLAAAGVCAMGLVWFTQRAFSI